MNGKILKTALVAALVAVLPLSLAFGGGAGGVTYGSQQFDPDLSNFNLQTRTVGGYGYGVSPWGNRTGGFGIAFFSDPAMTRPAGGVGGVITGQEFKMGPFMAAVNLWTGVGGMQSGGLGASTDFFILFGELTGEIGFAVTPWMQVVGYGGMQLMANLAPGEPFQAMLLYTPVLGVRLSWGSFSDHRHSDHWSD